MQPRKPSDVLSLFFHNHLDRILSPIGQPKPVPLPRARVTQLREQFIDQDQKAPEPKKPMYEAAIAVCDAVSAAMDERDKAIASLQGSAAFVHAPSDLGAHRKDIPSRGGLGTAMLADTTVQREAHEEVNRKQDARQTDNFFTVQQKNQWSQRALQLRQQIDGLAARERDQNVQPSNPFLAMRHQAAKTITLDKTIQIKVKSTERRRFKLEQLYPS